MRPVFGVMGTSGPVSEAISWKARQVGAAVASRGGILLTGATTGYSLEAARGAAAAGGLVIGISPASSRHDHERLAMPFDPHGFILFTGFGYKGRNVLNVRGCDAVLFVGGSIGTLNEFTIAFDEGKVIGVLTGSEGLSDHFSEIVERCRKPAKAPIVYESDPERLVERTARSIATAPGLGA